MFSKEMQKGPGVACATGFICMFISMCLVSWFVLRTVGPRLFILKSDTPQSHTFYTLSLPLLLIFIDMKIHPYIFFNTMLLSGPTRKSGLIVKPNPPFVSPYATAPVTLNWLVTTGWAFMLIIKD